jgi:Na+-transporting methylmalonyl-CoA/oxaloacetate decarboxylase beta subunit
MDYGHAVQFGVFITPVAQPEHSLADAGHANTYVIGGLEEPDALRWFSSDVTPAVREAVAKAR